MDLHFLSSVSTSIISTFTGCLSHCLGIFHNTAFNQRTHLAGKEVKQWATSHRINWLYHMPHQMEAGGLYSSGMAY